MQSEEISKILTEHGKAIFAKFLEQNSKLAPTKKKENLIVTQPDETVNYRQLKPKSKTGDFDITDETSAQIDLTVAEEEID